MSLRILYVLPYLPSPIRVRPYQLIRHLAQAGHRVTVAALGDASEADSAALAELRSWCAAVHVVPHPKKRAAISALLALPTPTPLWAAWCRSPEMERRLRELAASGDFDIAHIEHLRAAHFVRALDGLPCLFDSVDCITELRRQMATVSGGRLSSRLLSWEEWIKLRRYEPRMANAFPEVTVTSEYDAEALAALSVDSPITVIPNGVDLEGFRPEPGTPGRWSLVFSGKMSYAPNDDAARFLLSEVLPRIDALRPGGAPPVTVCIAGSGPGRRLRREAERFGDRVSVTGYVDDLRPYLTASRIAVCPLRMGMGIQNKALEAMASGLPVAATPLVGRALSAAEAAGAMRLAPDADGLARICAEWLADPEGASAAGLAARAYVEAEHPWTGAADRFQKLYRKLCLTAPVAGE